MLEGSFLRVGEQDIVKEFKKQRRYYGYGAENQKNIPHTYILL